MTATDLLGTSLSLPTLERRLTAHCRKWMPQYLRAAEREEEVGPDGGALVVGSLPLPRTWRATSGPVDKWPEDQLPAVIFGSPGLAEGGPRRDGRGLYAGTWAFGFTAVTSGRDDVATRWLCGVYAVALRLMFVQQPAVEGLDVQSCEYQDEGYDPLPFRRTGSLMAGTVTFTIGVGGLASARHGLPAPTDGGLPVPPADPTADPGPVPTVQTTHHQIERTPVA